MSTMQPWVPKYVERRGDRVVVHMYVPGGQSLCQLAHFSAAVRADMDMTVEACGPCMVAAGVVRNFAMQMLHGTSGVSDAPETSAAALAAGRFGEITRPEAILEWARGENHVDLPPRDFGDWGRLLGAML